MWKLILDGHICIYYRQTYKSSIHEKAVDEIISEKQEEKILKSNNIAQSESQVIEDEDDDAMFDAPQKSVNKSVESNNCSKVREKSKPEDQNIKKAVESSNIQQNASQIIEDESSLMDFTECVGDVSCLFYLLLFIK